ncbi:unnamed protein product [Meloidogyne enterolobii]|uniref:Uncharacterized protein n=1 Tax=Meloidogyne enterolobii TaxID=390850 RepID=A0ACB1AZI2_MELEN
MHLTLKFLNQQPKKFAKRLAKQIADYAAGSLMAKKQINIPDSDTLIDRLKLEDLLKRRFFYDQSFAIYGGVGGLYDYGPMGCALKQNMIQLWRTHFILEEAMLEVECSSLTPESVLKASGHVDRFVDWMVKDKVTGACFRADHLIKNHAEAIIKDKKAPENIKKELENVLIRLDGMSCADLGETIRKYDFKSPLTGNDVTEPVSFNLMFPTQIGPTGDFSAFLRPETAQGIFINFKRLLEFNQGRLPFAAAQVGTGFRNEISPRQGLVRVREFTMCEIEHFVDPSDKNHPKFEKVADVELTLFSACNQLNEKGTEKDCWDAECLTTHGWIESVGIADRSCYDLHQHSKATGVKLVAEKKLAESKQVDVVEAVPNKAAIGKLFKNESKKIIDLLKNLSLEQLDELEDSLKTNGLLLNFTSKNHLIFRKYSVKISDDKTIELDSTHVEVRKYLKTVHVEDVTPSVIEPSFGIGRVMYAVLEHSFRQREGDEKRSYLELAPSIAPIKCSILPISSNKRLDPIIQAVREELTSREISSKIDDSMGSIGRRYARTDEIGIPFGVTVDFDSEVEPWTVTLRY